MSENVPDDVKNRVKDSYDTIAKQYNSEFGLEGEYTRLDYLNKLINYFKDVGTTEATVLELGCGGGIPGTKTMLQNENPTIHVTANDLSSTQVDCARENLSAYNEKLTLVQGDMLGLSFADESFDAVVGFYSIIHLPREEQTQLMQKIVQWLKPGGYFLANFGLENQSVIVREGWLDAWMFWSSWGEEGSLKMVQEAGLEILDKEIKQRKDINNDAPFIWLLAKKASS